MEKQNVIQKERRNIYQYGINQMFNTILNASTFLIIGAILNLVFETFVFTFAYIPIRIYAGGFHAKTPFKCWIISSLMLFIALIIIKYIDMSVIFYDAFTALGVLAILLLSPVEDKNKPLDAKEKIVYKRKSVLVLGVELLSIITLRFFRVNAISICIELALIAISIMLILGIVKNIIIEKSISN